MNILDIEFDPWTEKDCIEFFVELHEEDFLAYCKEHGMEPNYRGIPALRFCEDNTAKFLDFADRYFSDLIGEEIDHQNDLKLDK